MPAEQVEKTHFIADATPRQLFDIVTDYDKYPQFFPEFTKVRAISSAQNDGPGVEKIRVEYVAKVVMVSVRYVLDMRHEAEKCALSWTFVEGEVVSDSVGSWRFESETGGTRIHYSAGITVKAPLPGFVLNKVSKAMLGTSIPNMFKALERESARRSGR